MILFHYILQVLALTQANATRQRTPGFQCRDGCRIGGVLVNVHNPWHGIARCFDGFNKEAFQCPSIPFPRQQKLDCLACGVDRTGTGTGWPLILTPADIVDTAARPKGSPRQSSDGPLNGLPSMIGIDPPYQPAALNVRNGTRSCYRTSNAMWSLPMISRHR